MSINIKSILDKSSFLFGNRIETVRERYRILLIETVISSFKNLFKKFLGFLGQVTLVGNAYNAVSGNKINKLADKLLLYILIFKLEIIEIMNGKIRQNLIHGLINLLDFLKRITEVMGKSGYTSYRTVFLLTAL